MRLRDYQQRAVDAVLADLQEVRSSLIVAATGTGKTVLFSHIAKAFAKYGRVLVLAHREELIYQAREKMAAVTGEVPDIEMGMEWADKPHMYDERAQYIVSTVQTQISGRRGKGRMSRFTPHDFSLVIADESHHATAGSWRKVLNYYQQNPNIKILGVTATPDRKDKAALGQVFDRVSFVYDINDGINDGWLVPITQQTVIVEGLDFSTVRTTAGDLNGADLAAILEYEKNLHGIADPTFQLARGRKTLVFAASVAHAERLAEILNRHKQGCARFICGETESVTRKRILRDFKDGCFQFLCNVGVLTEGYDEPSTEVIAVARPTKSRALYCQIIGRGTRPLPGIVDSLPTAERRREAIAASAKPSVEVLDFVGNAGRHKLITTADILGGNYSDAVIEMAAKEAREAKGPVDMRKLLQKAEEELERRRQELELRRQAEAATRAKLIGKATYSTQTINAFNLFDLAPPFDRGGDKRKPATSRQVDFLRKQGIPNPAELSVTAAGQLIGEIKRRWETRTCSFKQAKVLERYGYPTDMSASEAKQTIDAIVANGWKRPTIEAAAKFAGAAEGEI